MTDNASIRCGALTLKDYSTPIMPLEPEELSKLEVLLKNCKDSNLSHESSYSVRIKNRILASKYVQIGTGFFGVGVEYNMNGVDYKLPRFITFPYFGKNYLEISMNVKLSCLSIIFSMRKANEFIYKSMFYNEMIKAFEFFNDYVFSYFDGEYISNEHCGKDIMDKYFGKKFMKKAVEKKFCFTLNTITPPETREKIAFAQQDFDNDIFIIADDKDNILSDDSKTIPDYPLYVGTHDKKMYLIDNPCMQEYLKLKI